MLAVRVSSWNSVRRTALVVLFLHRPVYILFFYKKKLGGARVSFWVA
jgi:hypothetical protein